jgi:CO/xanthine dehydrogenase FAD-binding subunit
VKPPEFEYARPTSIAEAVAMLQPADGDAKVLAGGQSLVPLMNFRLAAPSRIVDINRIPELSFVDVADGVLRLGTMARTRTLELDPLVRQTIPVLAAAAPWIGHVQIRNRGTVGGSLAHADPAAELPAVCLMLDAAIIARGPAGEREIPASGFFGGFMTTALEPDELMVEVRIPIRTGDRWGFREFAQRRGDFALAGAVVSIVAAGTAVERARVVVFGTPHRPIRSEAAEAILVDGGTQREAIAAAASRAAEDAAAEESRLDATYRRTLMETMVRRALEDAVGGAGDRLAAGATT